MSNITHLRELESESIYVLREVAAQFERPAILFSGGKDSIVIVHLAYKAFYPAKIPFPLVHIDTGQNFQETIDYRDALAERLGAELIVGSVQESIDTGRVKEETGYYALDTIDKYHFDAAIGGARRDEEKARAKERFFSHRDEFGQWNPKNQRPELWNIFNGRKAMGEHFRVFPISNWTEMDVWQYILQEKIEMPSLYFTHERQVFERDGQWLAAEPCIKLKPTEQVVTKQVRCRTIGDITCTGLTISTAHSVEDIIEEIAATRVTERGGESGIAYRRSEGRARAGHHHRCGLSLFCYTQEKVYHCRHARTHTIYPKHGDWRFDCRPQHHPG